MSERTMTLPEGLARQILRVAKLRRHYEDIGPVGAFGLAMVDQSLERACMAAGSSDIQGQIAALTELKEINA